MKNLLLFLSFTCASHAALVPPSRMTASLPGIPDTAPYAYFSGFLNGGTPPSGRGTMYLHYICAMAPDWENKPLSIWYNGGPGAPSLYGLFQEFGPYLLTEESYTTDQYRKTNIPTPIYNPWTWVNVTSICEIDSPAPMGASYCSEGNGTAGSFGGPGGDPYSCGPWTDKTVAAANHQAHIAFFNDAFPEFEGNQQPVSLVGESYAGVYVPLFANAWLDDPVRGPKGKLINFKGFAVGDGFPACIEVEGKPIDWCVNLNSVGFFKYPNALPGPYWDIEFFHGHSQMSESLYHNLMDTCSMDELKGKLAPAPLSGACEVLVEQMQREVGYFYVYNVYGACPTKAPTTPKHRMIAGNTGPVRRQNYVPLTPSAGDGDSGLGAPCLGDAMGTYFGLNETKEAFGIPLSNRFIALDNGIGFNYTTDSAFVGYVYRKAVAAGKRVLVYEGDSDACGLQTAPIQDVWVPFFGNGTRAADEQWTPAGPLDLSGGNTTSATPLGLTMTQSWQPFALAAGRRVQGGFSMAWADGQVTFVSIRGAGHLVPLYRPAASFAMMKAFQAGEPLPPPFYP